MNSKGTELCVHAGMVSKDTQGMVTELASEEEPWGL